MYEIRPETVKTFIIDRNIKLPRFQRKQTWDEKKNFQLCISLFKEYPIGVCILSVDVTREKTVRWLLDGRQRKNALSLIYEDPENENLYSDRFLHVEYLQKMGAKISIVDSKATIEGGIKLKGTEVEARDIRGGASLLIGALAAEGKTTIDGTYHIERGYSKIYDKLKQLGVNVILKN